MRSVKPGIGFTSFAAIIFSRFERGTRKSTVRQSGIGLAFRGAQVR